MLELLRNLAEYLRHCPPISGSARRKQELLTEVAKLEEEHRRYQDEKNPLKITDWIAEGEFSECGNTAAVFHDAGRKLEKCGALEALGANMFRCENGKMYEMIVCAQICEVTDEQVICDFIDSYCDGERFLTSKRDGRFCVTDRVTGETVKSYKVPKFKSLKEWADVLNENHDETLKQYFRGG